MLAACKQPGLHQTIALMFMLKGQKITKVPRERAHEKKFTWKRCPVGHEISIKSLIVRKTCIISFVTTHQNYFPVLARDSIQSFIMIVCLDSGILRVKKLSRRSRRCDLRDMSRRSHVIMSI